MFVNYFSVGFSKKRVKSKKVFSPPQKEPCWQKKLPKNHCKSCKIADFFLKTLYFEGDFRYNV